MNNSIKPYNNKKQRHGYWEIYTINRGYYKCFYHNGKESGYGEYYYKQDKLIKTFHII